MKSIFCHTHCASTSCSACWENDFLSQAHQVIGTHWRKAFVAEMFKESLTWKNICRKFAEFHDRANLICHIKKTFWPESASELYRPSDRLLSAKFVPNFVDRGCYVVSATNPNGRFLCFIDRSRCFFFQVAPQLYSRGSVDPVPDPLLRKSGRARKRTRTSGPVSRNYDH
jgi:hypothetical protein